MDFLNNLLTQAAGYFGQEQRNDAQLALANLGLQPLTTPAAATVAPAPMAAQIVPGVANGTLLIAGASLFALGIVALSLRRK